MHLPSFILGIAIIGCGQHEQGGQMQLLSHSDLDHPSRQLGPVINLFGSEERGWFGYHVAGIGDLNRDDVPDVVVSEHWAHVGGDTRGKIHAISGSDGKTIFSLSGTKEHKEFGSAIAGVGDLNADGYPDILVGDQGADQGDERLSGKVLILSGQD